MNDITAYTPFLKQGGYLVIDDCANKFSMPWGYFQGIETVSQAVDDILPPYRTHPQFKHLYNVVHNRVWRKL